MDHEHQVRKYFSFLKAFGHKSMRGKKLTTIPKASTLLWGWKCQVRQTVVQVNTSIQTVISQQLPG